MSRLINRILDESNNKDLLKNILQTLKKLKITQQPLLMIQGPKQQQKQQNLLMIQGQKQQKQKQKPLMIQGQKQQQFYDARSNQQQE